MRDPMTPLRILHLSDIHLRGDGALHMGITEPAATFAAALVALEVLGEVDLIVASGDLSDDGSVASYQALRDALTAFAARHGVSGSPAPIVYAPGNHDQRPGFRGVLGGGVTAGAFARDNDQRPIYGRTDVAGFRVLSIDTSVPSRTHGYVDEEQLAWLSDTLATDAGKGTVLVLHHPPVPPITPLHQGIALINPAHVTDIVRDSDVRLILAGHYHHALIDSIPGRDERIPVVVAAGVINATQVLRPEGWEHVVAGSGANMIEVTVDAVESVDSAGRGRVSTRVRVLPLDLTPGATLSLINPSQVAQIAAQIDATDAERAAAVTRTPLQQNPTEGPMV